MARSGYKPEFCDQVLEFGAQGMSVAEMALNLGCKGRRTLYDWRERHPDFDQAVKNAQFLSQGFWEGLGRKAVQGQVKGFKEVSYIFQMKNRFREDWRDRHEVGHDVSDPLAALLEQIGTAKRTVNTSNDA